MQRSGTVVNTNSEYDARYVFSTRGVENGRRHSVILHHLYHFIIMLLAADGSDKFAWS